MTVLDTSKLSPIVTLDQERSIVACCLSYEKKKEQRYVWVLLFRATHNVDGERITELLPSLLSMSGWLPNAPSKGLREDVYMYIYM
jgi:hypothetical protein